MQEENNKNFTHATEQGTLCVYINNSYIKSAVTGVLLEAKGFITRKCDLYCE